MISVVGQRFFEHLGRPLQAAANARRYLCAFAEADSFGLTRNPGWPALAPTSCPSV